MLVNLLREEVRDEKASADDNTLHSLEEKIGISFTIDSRTRLYDFLELHFNEVVVGVDVLLHQSLDLKKGR